MPQEHKALASRDSKWQAFLQRKAVVNIEVHTKVATDTANLSTIEEEGGGKEEPDQASAAQERKASTAEIDKEEAERDPGDAEAAQKETETVVEETVAEEERTEVEEAGKGQDEKNKREIEDADAIAKQALDTLEALQEVSMDFVRPMNTNVS